MSTNQETPKIPLPKGWKLHVRLPVLHVTSLAQYATAYTRSRAADSANSRSPDYSRMVQDRLTRWWAGENLSFGGSRGVH